MAKTTRIDNPYTTGYIVNYKEGDQSLERFTLNYQPAKDDILHPVTDSDTLGSLAYDYYGNSKYWWIIADINKIFNPFELTVNSNLIIPNLDRIKATAL